MANLVVESVKYDPLGRRIEKTSPSATSIFVYDGDNLIETVTGSGGTVARYTLGQNIDEPLAVQRGTTTSFYEADGVGSITSLSSTSGTLAQNYTYDSFGNQTASSGSITNFFRYTAREFDTETNLYYYRARYYDPAIGRFISEDPIRLSSGDIDFYDYVYEAPTKYRDPSGNGVFGAGIPIGGAVGIVYGGLGALTESQDLGDIFRGAAVGGLIGAGMGALLPDEGILTSSAIGAAAAAAGDALAQQGSCEPFNPWHLLAAAAGGLAGTATSGVIEAAAGAEIDTATIWGKEIAGNSIGMPTTAIAATAIPKKGAGSCGCGK